MAEKGKGLYNKAMRAGDGRRHGRRRRRWKLKKMKQVEVIEYDSDDSSDGGAELARYTRRFNKDAREIGYLTRNLLGKGRRLKKHAQEILNNALMGYVRMLGNCMLDLDAQVSVQIKERKKMLKKMEGAKKAVARAKRDRKAMKTMNTLLSVAGGIAMFIPGGQLFSLLAAGASFAIDQGIDIAESLMDKAMFERLQNAMLIDKHAAIRIANLMLELDYLQSKLDELFDVPYDVSMLTSSIYSSEAFPYSDKFTKKAVVIGIMGGFGVPGCSEDGVGAAYMDELEKAGLPSNETIKDIVAAGDFAYETKEFAEALKGGAKHIKKTHKAVKKMFKPKTARTARAMWKIAGSKASALGQIGAKSGGKAFVLQSSSRWSSATAASKASSNASKYGAKAASGGKKLLTGAKFAKGLAAVGIIADAATLVTLWANDEDSVVQEYLKEWEEDLAYQLEDFKDLKFELDELLH